MRIYYCYLNKLKLQRPNKVGRLKEAIVAKCKKYLFH